MILTSPCTGICKLDETTGWCLGCGRTGDEIGGWRGLPEPQRDHVWAQIPDRLGQLGVACRRLPWTTEDIRSFVTQSCEEKRGTWVMGVLGAVAEFVVPPSAPVDMTMRGEDIVAHTPTGAMCMTINDDIRAVTFDPPGLKKAPTVVLAVKRERGRLQVADGISDLGQDADALIPEAATQLYDLGLGRKEGRFCVRVGDGPARQALDAVKGMPFSNGLPRIGATLLSESPTRVVQRALGRIGRALPVGMDLPRAYLPGAVFYPKAVT